MNPLRAAAAAFFFLYICSANAVCDEKTSPLPSINEAKLSLLLEEVYRTMDDHYYLPVSRQAYDDFVKTYTPQRLLAMNLKSRQTEDAAHLGAGLLVNKLKHPADRFTNFVPPDLTKKFKSDVYAVTEDLGIEGKKTAGAFKITKVQKHSDAFKEGIRPGDWLLEIDGEATASLTEEGIAARLTPEVGKTVTLVIRSRAGQTRAVSLQSKPYFKETVDEIPSGVKGVEVIKISRFNEKTADDFAESLSSSGIKKTRHLVLDLRDNGGGPPLAAREILGLFLPQNEFLFAISRKKQRPVMLTAPRKAAAYKGPVTVLVNQKTGSAAEMFSGILQAKKIARLAGQKTAGATYLKSIYDLKDGSLVFMITSLTYFYDRRVFPPDGLTPDIAIAPEKDALKFILSGLA